MDAPSHRVETAGGPYPGRLRTDGRVLVLEDVLRAVQPVQLLLQPRHQPVRLPLPDGQRVGETLVRGPAGESSQPGVLLDRGAYGGRRGHDERRQRTTAVRYAGGSLGVRYQLFSQELRRALLVP